MPKKPTKGRVVKKNVPVRSMPESSRKSVNITKDCNGH